MPDVKEVYEMVTKQKPPQPGGLERQWDRQRRSARNRKAGVIALVAAIFIALGVFAIARAPGRGSHPASPPPTRLEPPLGAQVISTDGAAVEQIPGLPSDAHWLRLSPDGQAIAFRTWDGDGYQVATMRIDGTGLRILTHDGYLDPAEYDGGWPAWSPDGSKIAYSARDDIYVMGADGSHARRVTTAAGGDFSPEWSPDARTLVYVHGHNREPDREVYTIPVAGGSPTRLTHNDLGDSFPDWSSTGWIVFGRGGSDNGVWIMRPDGSHAERVATGADPQWSPDGTMLSYQTLRIHADGSWDVGAGPVGSEEALLRMHIIELGSGTISTPGVRWASDWGMATWVSNSTLLVNRYD